MIQLYTRVGYTRRATGYTLWVYRYIIQPTTLWGYNSIDTEQGTHLNITLADTRYSCTCKIHSKNNRIHCSRCIIQSTTLWGYNSIDTEHTPIFTGYTSPDTRCTHTYAEYTLQDTGYILPDTRCTPYTLYRCTLDLIQDTGDTHYRCTIDPKHDTGGTQYRCTVDPTRYRIHPLQAR